MRRIYAYFFVLLFSSGLAAQSDLVLTGLFDGPLVGGTPKGVELYATGAIPDLSIYGLGVANNGGGTDGQEFTFPADNIAAGTYLYVSLEDTGFDIFFGMSPDYLDNIASINGNDPVELYKDGVVVDVYGDIALDGSGQPWDYLDGWAYRVPGSGPDGSTFVLANWTFSGINVFDDETSNASAATPMPIGTYGSPQTPDYTIEIQGLSFVPSDITIEFGETVLWTNTTAVNHNVNGSTTDYPLNPEGFFSGSPDTGWEFLHTFTKAGKYDYHCDPHLGAGMTGTITVNEPVGSNLPIAVVDDISIPQNGSATINVLFNDVLPSAISSFTIIDNVNDGQAMIMGDSSIVYNPEQDFCGEDSLSYEVCVQMGLCDTAAVYFNVVCIPQYPAYPINLLTTNNAAEIPDSLETKCEITGIVYGINFRPSGLQFTLIDKADADAGIGIFLNTGNLGYTVTEGDEIVVQGEVDFFSGITQIQAEAIQLVSQGNELHDPTSVTALSEATESKLIAIENATIVDETLWVPGGSGFNITVTDGVNDYDVRIDADSELHDMPVPTFTVFRLVGVGGQFDGSEPHDEGYQILPRTIDDFQPFDAVVELNDPNLKLFPNPVSDELTVVTGISWEQIELYDVQGRLLQRLIVTGKKHVIQTGHLINGQYWLKLINAQGVASKSFQKN